MKKHMMNNMRLVGILVLMVAILIGCESGGGDETTPAGPSNLYAWGSNSDGQLGIGNETVQNAPVAITSTKTWKQVSAGVSHTLTIDSDDHLFAWGSNSSGQLGNGESGDGVKRLTPVKIGDKTWKQVSARGFYTLAIDSDDHLFAWGDNEKGQLGNGESGNKVIRLTPVKIGDKTWKQVSAGGYHSVAIDSDDHLFAWGSNSSGQLGNGESGNEVIRLTPVKIGDKTWKQVSAGVVFTMAIDSDDHLFAWGRNNVGQLGIGTETIEGNEVLVNKNAPVKIGDKTWKQVSAGSSSGFITDGHTMAIDSNNHLFAWGFNIFGQLGIGNTDNQNAPVQVVIGEDTTKTWKQVSAGGFYTIAIDNDNHLFAWGDNEKGQLGNGESGNEVKSTTPVAIEPTKTWDQISAGESHNLGIIQ